MPWMAYSLKIALQMHLHAILAISSLSAARLGIDGLVQIAVFAIGMVAAIGFVGRHEYSPSGYAIFGVIAVSLISAGIGGAVGQGLSSLVGGVVFCGAASLLTSGPFLDFRTPHRLVLGAVSPFLLILSIVVGQSVESFVLENALK